MTEIEITERVELTPVGKGEDYSILRLDRKAKQVPLDKRTLHVAGGQNKGLVVNKQLSEEEIEFGIPDSQLEFKVYLVNSDNDTQTLESRKLKFWFKDDEDSNDVNKMSSAHNFFRDLVNPKEFPADYVGFIKRMMKLMQKQYPVIKTLRIELRQLPVTEGLPNVEWGSSELEPEKTPLTLERLLELIEQAYPNSVQFNDILKSTSSSEAEIRDLLDELVARGVIRQTENGSWLRVAHNEQEVHMVRQMPQVPTLDQPSIAIITAQYAEKLAVDSMMRNKTTYMRYQTTGESNVYTLGDIGPFRCVSTKLPVTALSGDYRSATIAAGNTTTRLLGIFQHVEYVFVVGTGGAVPHYTDAQKHVRLGDIVVSTPTVDHPYMYLFCEEAKKNLKEGTVTYTTKSWRPPSEELQFISQQLVKQNSSNPDFAPWFQYSDEALHELRNTAENMDFYRPAPETDKLFMSIGDNQVIEVAHPEDSSLQNSDAVPQPKIHLGPIGGGRSITRDQLLRQDFSQHYGALAYDYEFDTVMESIFGNRKDNYICIRGMADYRDGMRNKDWVPYAALNAASFMKSVICSIPATHHSASRLPNSVSARVTNGHGKSPLHSNGAIPPPILPRPVTNGTSSTISSSGSLSRSSNRSPDEGILI